MLLEAPLEGVLKLGVEGLLKLGEEEGEEKELLLSGLLKLGFGLLLDLVFWFWKR
jgi:hypothetical protein